MMAAVTLNKKENKKENEYLTSDIKSFWKFNNQLGFRNLFYGIDYQRTLEYPVTFNQLQINSEVKSLLDIGTGKHSIFPLYVSYKNPEITVRMTDLGSYVFKQVGRIQKHKTLNANYQNSKILIEKQDATRMTYEDNTFDRVSAVSAIEHIPDDGDSLAVKEIIRVLKPGGRAVITVPYECDGYRAAYRKRTTYTRKYNDKPVFFSHYYDDKALYERLMNDSSSELESILYLGEREFPYFEFWCTKVPLRNFIKYFMGWFNLLMALKYYLILNEDEKAKAHVAVISLIKR